MGNSGILSFAHIGFMGVGAYTSAVLTIPAQMKGMALPDLYPFLSGVQLSPYLGDPRGGLVAAAVAAAVAYPLMRLSDAAAVITSFALLVVLHNVMTNWCERDQRPAHALRPAQGDHAAAGRRRRRRRAGGRARLQGIAHRPACCARPATTRSPPPPSARTSRGCAGGPSSSRALLAGHRRRALGPLHHLVLAERLLSQGDLPDPRHAGDRRPQHRDRRGGRRLRRHRRLRGPAGARGRDQPRRHLPRAGGRPDRARRWPSR